MEDGIEIWQFTDEPPRGKPVSYSLEKQGTLLTIGSDDPTFPERQAMYSAPKVLAFLEFLVSANGHARTREEILDRFWKRAKNPRIVDHYLGKLRGLLNDDSTSNRRGNVLSGRIIETLSGGGLRFAPKVKYTLSERDDEIPVQVDIIPDTVMNQIEAHVPADSEIWVAHCEKSSNYYHSAPPPSSRFSSNIRRIMRGNAKRGISYIYVSCDGLYTPWHANDQEESVLNDFIGEPGTMRYVHVGEEFLRDIALIATHFITLNPRHESPDVYMRLPLRAAQSGWVLLDKQASARVVSRITGELKTRKL